VTVPLKEYVKVDVSICYLKKFAHSKWKGAKSRKIVKVEEKWKEFEEKKRLQVNMCVPAGGQSMAL
jgi:hypothetical protein